MSQLNIHRSFVFWLNKYLEIISVAKLILLTTLLILSGSALSQPDNIEYYQFISPKPGSSLILPENNIIIRQGNIIENTTINAKLIEVIGTESGFHTGEFLITDDMRTLIFKPDVSYYPGEKVSVKFYGGLRTNNGNVLRPIEFDFHISSGVTERDKYIMMNELYDCKLNFNHDNVTKPVTYKLNSETGLPEDFPPITIDTLNNPSPGYLFFAPYTLTTFIGYLIIMDNNGVPIFYERTPYERHALQIQQNRWLTFGDSETNYFYLMDSSYSAVDSFTTGNGYLLNIHDFQFLPNGHALLLAYDWQTIRMDTVVAGGDTAAIVLGAIIQEVDASKNVIFEWRSWDHFQITDATEDINLTDHAIDYVHANAIELDNDGNILLSSRNMDEITKINRQTEEIIWRMGGVKSRKNQFQFFNDTRTFSHQHDIRRLSNGNVSLFDNGALLIPQYSRVLEYELDENNREATLVWEFSYDPPFYKNVMGNMQRLLNGNTIIGWGGFFSPDRRAISEVNFDGSVALELSLPDTITNYQAFKFPWKMNLFVTDPNSIFFESIPVGDSATMVINLISNSPQEINITGFFNSDSSYIVEHSVPFILPPYGLEPIAIKFKPVEDGFFYDVLHIRWDTETKRIAQTMVMTGRTDTIFAGVLSENNVREYKLAQNYPNPFSAGGGSAYDGNPGTKIRFTIPNVGRFAESLNKIEQTGNSLYKVTLKVFDVLGNEIATLVNEDKSAGSYEVEFDGAGLPSGIYFYRLQAGNYIETKKMILMK